MKRHHALCLQLGLLLALPQALSCNGEATSSAQQPSATASSSGAVAVQDEALRVETLLAAELTRSADQIKVTDISARDVRVRRQAARALARVRSEHARVLLLRGLSDEDEQVVAWSAYGLGDICAAHREATVSALVAAAASRAPTSKDDGLDAMRAITRAVGRCASPRSEAILVGWARTRGPYMLDAIYAIGDLARKRKRLREDTYVALLKLAEGDAANEAVPTALYPIGRVEHLTPSVIERTREVAVARLATAGIGRTFAVRALGRADDASVPLLAKVLTDTSTYNANERAEAANALVRFSRKGQKALGAALSELVPKADPLAATALVSPNIGPLLLTMEGLTDLRKAKTALDRISKLVPPPDAPKPIKRRITWLRCTAAKLLAERDFVNPTLRACDLAVAEDKRAVDPIESSIAARAVVAAIGVDGVRIRGKRLAAWRAYAEGGDIRARQAALKLLNEHGEIKVAAEVLAKALDHEASGVVATAAEVIEAHPARVLTGKDGALDEHVKKALMARLAPVGPTEDLETLGVVVKAIGKLKIEEAKEALVGLCSSPHPSLREHTQKALASIMGKASPKCARSKAPPVPEELSRRINSVTTLKLTTDAGELSLTLDPTFAPIAVTRAVSLAKNGYYDGMVVHRVVPGFVSQFGSPTSDGYGGVQGLPPLPCETSPLRFAPHTVGVALAGRDTGSSQFFVTHASTPHLDGAYAIIGRADGPWDALIDGDVIHGVKIIPQK